MRFHEINKHFFLYIDTYFMNSNPNENVKAIQFIYYRRFQNPGFRQMNYRNEFEIIDLMLSFKFKSYLKIEIWVNIIPMNCYTFESMLSSIC